MSEALIPGETLDWPSFGLFKFEVGDLVFFYASNPICQLIGKLEIERTDLPFSEANPRNDLRKWPRHHSRIPWLRLRVLQSAPVPFKPLQRGSLYYHTEFKPSPYPKLLHDNECDYVFRAFDEAMTYDADMIRYDNGIESRAIEKVTRGEILTSIIEELKGGRITSLVFSRTSTSNIDVTLSRSADPEIDAVTLHFKGVHHILWDLQTVNDLISGIRLTVEDTYLLCQIDGASAEILAEDITID
ncbi:MAG: hypothetical protein K2M04_03725 [Muribaculaceae bacterium]|nr:hypothetical protein [Muribaculaceae bacterium]